jgi:hypothetical protein
VLFRYQYPARQWTLFPDVAMSGAIEIERRRALPGGIPELLAEYLHIAGGPETEAGTPARAPRRSHFDRGISRGPKKKPWIEEGWMSVSVPSCAISSLCCEVGALDLVGRAASKVLKYTRVLAISPGDGQISYAGSRGAIQAVWKGRFRLDSQSP